MICQDAKHFGYKLVKNKYALTYKISNFLATVDSLSISCATLFISKAISLISSTAAYLKEEIHKYIDK